MQQSKQGCSELVWKITFSFVNLLPKSTESTERRETQYKTSRTAPNENRWEHFSWHRIVICNRVTALLSDLLTLPRARVERPRWEEQLQDSGIGITDHGHGADCQKIAWNREAKVEMDFQNGGNSSNYMQPGAASRACTVVGEISWSAITAAAYSLYKKRELVNMY